MPPSLTGPPTFWDGCQLLANSFLGSVLGWYCGRYVVTPFDLDVNPTRALARLVLCASAYGFGNVALLWGRKTLYLRWRRGQLNGLIGSARAVAPALKRPTEIVLFVGGVCLIGFGRPWSLTGVVCLLAWYWLWHARPLGPRANQGCHGSRDDT